MDQKKLLGPILLRFAFFAFNLYFAIRVTGHSGWSFFSILLAIFATRDFVHTVRLSQFYFHVKKVIDDEKKDK